MREKRYTWRSYIFLTMSILILLSWVLLDSIGRAFGESYASVLMYFMIFGFPLSIIFAMIAMFTKSEKKMLAIIALIITFINIAVIGFFLWFGYQWYK